MPLRNKLSILLVLCISIIFAIGYYGQSGSVQALPHETFREEKTEKKHPGENSIMYTFEKQGLCRYNPGNDIDPQSKNKHALFFGCSFAFGKYLTDNATLATWFSYFAPQYRTYNFAYSGYGPHQALFLLKKHNLTEIVSENEGIAIYVYISDQVHRVIGDAHWMSWPDAPCFYINKNGHLDYKGSFRNTKPLRTLVLIGWRTFCKFIHHEEYTYLPAIREKDYALTASIILGIQKEYLKLFPQGQFFVLLYPPVADDQYIRKYLRKNNIRYIDFPELALNQNSGKRDPQYFLDDGHPNELLHKIIARTFYKKI